MENTTRQQEIEMLKNELLTIQQENKHNKMCATLCAEALTLADRIKQGKDTSNFLLKITKHGGKMQNIRSLSTYKLVCDTCTALKNAKNTICRKCYADKTINMYKQLAPALIYNTLLLKYTKLSRRQLPVIMDQYFRFESFSDLQNLQHLENLYAIARYNKNTHFALWSKNYKLLLQLKTPRNVNLILSSFFINSVQPCSELILNAVKNKTGCKHVKFFSVYDSAHIGALQNCAKKCATCLKCYKVKNTATYIYELLK